MINFFNLGYIGYYENIDFVKQIYANFMEQRPLFYEMSLIECCANVW